MCMSNTQEEILELFQNDYRGDGYIVKRTSNIADAVGCDEETARHHLEALADQGEIIRSDFSTDYWLYSTYIGARRGVRRE